MHRHIPERLCVQTRVHTRVRYFRIHVAEETGHQRGFDDTIFWSNGIEKQTAEIRAESVFSLQQGTNNTIAGYSFIGIENKAS